MFLSEPPPSEAGQSLHDADRESQGYVDNLTRLWCWRPELMQQYSLLRRSLAEVTELPPVDLAVLDVATAAARESSYCGLAKGSGLAALADADSAAALASGAIDSPDARTAALAAWARQVAVRPSGTTAEDVKNLQELGLSDQEIFDATVTVALRVMFATVNDALGAQADAQLVQRAPAVIRKAVRYGRQPADEPST